MILHDAWDSGILSDLCSLRKETCNPIDCNLDIYVGLEHIESGKFFLKRHGLPKEVKSTKNRFYVGDVIYGKLRPYLDKAVVAESEGICSTDILVFMPNANVPPNFLAGVLHCDKFIQHAVNTTHGVNHPRTSWKSLKGYGTQIPPLKEQQKIAAVLFKIQQAIEVQESIIEAAQELKKSTMQHVFTYGLRGEKTKGTEIGRMPESWVKKKLGEIAKISYGAQAAVANAKDPDIGTPILTNVNITIDGKLNIAKLRYYAVPSNKRDRLILRKGDLLFNWRSGSQSHVGKTTLFMVDKEFTYSSFILRFRASRNFHPNYLYYYFNYLKQNEFFSNRRNVSSINSVYNASLSATIPIYFPENKQYQIEVANLIKVVDDKVELHSKKKSALQDLFKTMLNKLMTGVIRVKGPNIDTSCVLEMKNRG